MAEKKIVTPEEKAKVISLFKGTITKEIKSATGLAHTTIRNILIEAKVIIPKKRKDKEFCRVTLNNEVLTTPLYLIARKYNINVESLHYYLRKLKIDIPKPAPKKKANPWNHTTNWNPITCR